jgi:hypothetical protein
MKVTKIIVSAGRTFNHPYEDYSDLKSQITLKATVDDGENFEDAVKELQRKAETMVQDHKMALLDAIHKYTMMSRKEQEIQRLESLIKTAQDDLARARADFEPALLGAMPDA